MIGIQSKLPAYLVAGYINRALGIELTYKEEVYNVADSIKADVYFPIFYYKSSNGQLEYKLIGVKWGETVLRSRFKRLNLLLEINSFTCENDIMLLKQYIKQHSLAIKIRQENVIKTEETLKKLFGL